MDSGWWLTSGRTGKNAKIAKNANFGGARRLAVFLVEQTRHSRQPGRVHPAAV
jgi:hypothetical protein